MINGDKILAATAKYLKTNGRLKKNTVVATTMSNLGFERYLEEQAINLIRTDVGDKHVAKAMSDGGFNLGGEQSGHIIMSDFGLTGDGIIASLQVLANFVEPGAKTISSLFNMYDEMPQDIFNINCTEATAFTPEELVSLTSKFQRELGSNVRISIRKSGTEPVIRVMIEAESHQKIKDIFSQINLVLTDSKVTA